MAPAKCVDVQCMTDNVHWSGRRGNGRVGPVALAADSSFNPNPNPNPNLNLNPKEPP